MDPQAQARVGLDAVEAHTGACEVRSLVVRRVTVQRETILTRATNHFRFGDEKGAQRTRTIARTFLRGYNTLAAGGGLETARREAGLVEPYFRPFFLEGAAMGYGPWAMHRPQSDRGFEDFVGRLAPHVLYQNYVGYGWWLSTRYRDRPRHIASKVARLDFRYRLLCFEGIGFRSGFMAAGQRPKGMPQGISRGDRQALHGWCQGFGRSIWFVHMGDFDGAVAAMAEIPPTWQADAFSGLGTGLAFSYLDEVELLGDRRNKVAPNLRADFDQGIAFGWEARAKADSKLFNSSLDSLNAKQKEQVFKAVEVVHNVRDRLTKLNYCHDFYNEWRRGVAAAMRQNPLSAF